MAAAIIAFRKTGVIYGWVLNIPPVHNGETLIIEGAGGALIPLNEKDLMVDLMLKCDAPVILVARTMLGTINHTLLSLEYMRNRGLKILGVVTNGPEDRVSRDAVEHFGRVDVLAGIENIEHINPESLKDCFRRNFA
jgi:dethiobiotin synthetase/malonyl-CoA O-methyltransferase